MGTEELNRTASVPDPPERQLALGFSTREDAGDSMVLNDSSPFDIVQTYRNILASDLEITMPVAAIEALIELLRATPSSTAMETVEIIKTQASRLLDSEPNPLALQAGADLFQQYLLRSLRGQSVGPGKGPVLDFNETREHLLGNSKTFVARAKEARDSVVRHGLTRIRPGGVYMTAGGSRNVTQIMLRGAREGRHFKVIYVVDGSDACARAVAALREANIDVETIGPEKIAYMLAAVKAIAHVDWVMVGAEVMVQNGGCVSRMGTFTLAKLAKAFKIRVFVAAETHKIVRQFPLNQDLTRIGVKQRSVKEYRLGKYDEPDQDLVATQDEVDYTPPDLIEAIITEHGFKQPPEIYRMILDIYT